MTNSSTESPSTDREPESARQNPSVAPEDDVTGSGQGPVSRTGLTQILGRLRGSWPAIIVLLGFLAYAIAWSAISLTRFDNHHALVYDLGVTMEQMWLVTNSHYSLQTALVNFLYEGLPFVLFPVAVLGGYPAMLILQTLAVGGTAFPIYGIAARLLKDRTSAMLLALSSLVFFVSSGANWYDFHFEVFFPIIFLSAYYLLLVGQRKLSFALFLFVAFVRFPFGVFPLMFGLLVIFESMFLHRDVDGMPNRLARRYGMALALAATGLLLVTFFVALPVVLGKGQFTALLQFSQTTSSPGPAIGAFDRLLTLLLPLGALLFLPLFSRRWVLFLVPYGFLLFATGFWAYSYPYAFAYQYVDSIVPFLYLGTIDALAAGMPIAVLWGKRKSLDAPEGGTGPRVSLRAVSSSLLVVVVVAALFLQPYGPLNGLTPEPFDFQENLSANSTLLQEYDHLSALIPRSDPNVLIQGNMPELFPRPLAANEPLVPGVSLFANFSESDVVNGSFPLWQYGKTVYVPFDYAIADLNSPQFLYGTPSMQDFVQAMYGSGAYGILGEAGGMILLKHYYSGPVEYYEPVTATFPVSSLLEWPDYTPIAGRTIASTNVGGNTPLWNGPFTPLMPGSYQVSFALESTNTSGRNVALVQVLGGPRAALIVQSTLNGANFTAPDRWQNITVQFYASAPENYVQFILRSLQWNGTLTLSGISLRQLGPPSTTYRVGLSPRDDLFYQLLRQIPNGSVVLLQPGFSEGVLNLTVEVPGNQTVIPDFILADPFSPGFACSPSCNPNLSMEGLVDSALENRTYGVLAEVEGMILMQRGYLGTVATFAPYVGTYYPGDLFAWPSEDPLPNATLSVSNVSGSDWPALWNGPFSGLAPGTYTVTFGLRTTTTASTDQAMFQVLASPTANVLLYQEPFNGTLFPEANEWTNVSLTFSAPLSYDSAQFIVRALNWSGTLSLRTISVVQQSYP